MRTINIDLTKLMFPTLLAILISVSGYWFVQQNDAIAQKASKVTVTAKFQTVDSKIEHIKDNMSKKVNDETVRRLIELQQAKYDMMREQQTDQKQTNRIILESLQDLKIQVEKLKK